MQVLANDWCNKNEQYFPDNLLFTNNESHPKLSKNKLVSEQEDY